ncbi:MAG: hypothetical protein ACRD0W_25150, partial [Acidimicrobiales bacterium]
MRKARPSSLQLAELCPRAPWLSHKYKEGNQLTVEGSTVDKEAGIALAGGPEPERPEAIALVAWARKMFAIGAEFYVQRRVELTDPITGEVITGGTPDLIVHVPMFRKLYIVDWKKKGQWYAGHLAEPNKNLQQLTYGVAAGTEFRVDSFQIVLALFDEQGNVDPQESEPFPEDTWWGVIDRVKATPDFKPDEPEPAAIKGKHCNACYGRLHCSAYLLPAMSEAPVELVPFTEAGGGELTNDQAVAGLEWVERAKAAIKTANEVTKKVEEQLEAYALQLGPIRSGDK